MNLIALQVNRSKRSPILRRDRQREEEHSQLRRGEGHGQIRLNRGTNQLPVNQMTARRNIDRDDRESLV